MTDDRLLPFESCHGCGKRFTKRAKRVRVVVSIAVGPRTWDGQKRRGDFHPGCFPVHIDGLTKLPTITMTDLGLNREPERVFVPVPVERRGR